MSDSHIHRQSYLAVGARVLVGVRRTLVVGRHLGDCDVVSSGIWVMVGGWEMGKLTRRIEEVQELKSK